VERAWGKKWHLATDKYFQGHFEEAGYEYRSKKSRKIRIAEMRHSEELSDRILF